MTIHFNDLILLTLTIQSNAGDLTAAQWQTVLKNTHVLRGFQIREQNQDVVRAKRDGEQAECPQQHVLNVFQAFVLRPNGHPSDATQTPQLNPAFEIEDGSSIQIVETKNAFQRSLALKVFSKRCIEANLYDTGLSCPI